MRTCWKHSLIFAGLLALGCGDDSGGGDGGTIDGASPADAARSDASTVIPIPGEGECAWEPGARPTAELPPVHTNEYVLELERWAISNDHGDPVETRNRMNEAIQWAKDNGFDKIVVPAGRYFVGEPTNDIYAGGIELPSDVTLELSGAVIEMAPNDRWNYCVITAHTNTTIRGGEVLGERSEHTYNEAGEGHDEGHAICVWTDAVDRVLIEDMELHEVTGDGVLIVGRRGSDGVEEQAATNITIRNNHIHHNRRQGVSVVGGHNVVVENNHIHHIEGTGPSFGIDIEGAGRSDRDILIYRNNFHNNAGGDFVTSSGTNVWVEENTMTQCQVNEAGDYDPSLPCELDSQSDGPIVLWGETDNVILNNVIRMSIRTSNGLWGIIGYTNHEGAERENPIGNYIAGNTFFDSGIHMADNMRYFVSNNTINEGLMLGFQISCTRLEDNRINRNGGILYTFWGVAGQARGNISNRGEGALPEDDFEERWPMSDDAPYRNTSPVFW